MTYKEIQDLIKLINKSDLTEFKLKREDIELVIRTKSYYKAKETPASSGSSPSIVPIATSAMPPAVSAPPVPANTAPPAQPQETTAQVANEAAPTEEKASYLEIKSPIVGTFYRSPGPDKPPFKKVGDTVEQGETVCIVEAMKLFNEIESEVSGKIVKVLTEDASPVQYDQVLFLVDPNG